ncbi:MAG: hypothetical protein Kow0031_18960 [Anaerolineae bacterium]
MEESTLDLRITFCGEEEILSEINDKLISETADHTSLSQALSAIVRNTLIAAGVSSDFRVKIHQGPIKKDFGQSGGLNANEWMGGGLASE